MYSLIAFVTLIQNQFNFTMTEVIKSHITRLYVCKILRWPEFDGLSPLSCSEMENSAELRI